MKRLPTYLARLDDDEGLAGAVESCLSRLAAGVAGSDMADVAAELREGRMSLADVGDSSVARPHLQSGLTRYMDWRQEMAPGDLDRLLEDSRRRLTSDE